MKNLGRFFLSTLVTGLAVVAPIYLWVGAAEGNEIARVSPAKPSHTCSPKWLPADQFLSLLLVLAVCFLVGFALRTPKGRAGYRSESNGRYSRKSPATRSSGSLTQQRLAGENEGNTWKPALQRLKKPFVPAFIIEELTTVASRSLFRRFPRLLAGAVHPHFFDRVHPLNVPFTQAVKAVSKGDQGPKILSLRWTEKTQALPSRNPAASGFQAVLQLRQLFLVPDGE